MWEKRRPSFPTADSAAGVSPCCPVPWYPSPTSRRSSVAGLRSSPRRVRTASSLLASMPGLYSPLSDWRPRGAPALPMPIHCAAPPYSYPFTPCFVAPPRSPLRCHHTDFADALHPPPLRRHPPSTQSRRHRGSSFVPVCRPFRRRPSSFRQRVSLPLPPSPFPPPPLL